MENITMRALDHSHDQVVPHEHTATTEDDICPISMVREVPSICHGRCVWCPKELTRDEYGTSIFECFEDLYDLLAGIKKGVNAL